MLHVGVNVGVGVGVGKMLDSSGPDSNNPKSYVKHQNSTQPLKGRKSSFVS